LYIDPAIILTFKYM